MPFGNGVSNASRLKTEMPMIGLGQMIRFKLFGEKKEHYDQPQQQGHDDHR